MDIILKRSHHILIVEDDSAIRQLLYRFLSHRNYQVKTAETAELAISTLNQFQPELVILDLNLPDLNGLKLLEEIRWYTDAMIMVLTSSTSRDNKVKSFSMGADDFLQKPFDLDDLELRVNALLTRGQKQSRFQKRMTFDDLVVDPVRCEVLIHERLVDLTALEFRLLHFMAQQPGRVWTRAELLESVWGYQCLDNGRVVDVHIGQLRKKIEDNPGAPKRIHTIRGIGYRFEVSSEQRKAG